MKFFGEVITIAIRFASEIIKEIKEGGPIAASATSTNGEEYEKWLYEEDDIEPALMIKEKVISSNAHFQISSRILKPLYHQYR